MRVDRRALHTALKELNRLASHSTFADVLFSTKAGILSLTATDLTSRLVFEMPAEGNITTCLSAKLLTTLIKPEGRDNAGNVTIEPVGDRVNIIMGGTATRLPVSDHSLFPSGIANDQPWSLIGICAVAPLQEALTWALPAASKDPTRKHLNSVFINQDSVVATDGHRLHLAPSPIHLETPMLLPSSSATTLARILKQDQQIIMARCKTEDQDFLRVRCGSWELTTTLMDEAFPPYNHVIPEREAQQTQIIFDIKALGKALSQVMKLSEQGSVKVTVNGVVSLSPGESCLGEAEVVVPTITNTHDRNTPDLELGLSGKYLLDGLLREKGTVEMGLSGPLDPVRLDLSEQRLAVIMPVRLE